MELEHLVHILALMAGLSMACTLTDKRMRRVPITFFCCGVALASLTSVPALVHTAPSDGLCDALGVTVIGLQVTSTVLMLLYLYCIYSGVARGALYQGMGARMRVVLYGTAVPATLFVTLAVWIFPEHPGRRFHYQHNYGCVPANQWAIILAFYAPASIASIYSFRWARAIQRALNSRTAGSGSINRVAGKLVKRVYLFTLVCAMRVIIPGTYAAVAAIKHQDANCVDHDHEKPDPWFSESMMEIILAGMFLSSGDALAVTREWRQRVFGANVMRSVVPAMGNDEARSSVGPSSSSQWVAVNSESSACCCCCPYWASPTAWPRYLRRLWKMQVRPRLRRGSDSGQSEAIPGKHHWGWDNRSGAASSSTRGFGSHHSHPSHPSHPSHHSHHSHHSNVEQASADMLVQ